MRSYVLPIRYFLFLVIGLLIIAEILALEMVTDNLTIIIQSPFTHPLIEKNF